MSGFETWVLMFYLTSGNGFVGGEYQTHERCLLGAKHQLAHWRAHYHDQGITWTCRREADDVPVIIIEGERP